MAVAHLILGLVNTFFYLWLCMYTYNSYPLSLVIRILGMLIFLLGADIFIGAVSVIKWQAYLPDKSASLKDKGLYSRVRHPMYLGIFLSTLGLSLTFASKYSFIYSLVLLVSLFLLSLLEELDLSDRFKDEYKQYQKKVPRFFP